MFCRSAQHQSVAKVRAERRVKTDLFSMDSGVKISKIFDLVNFRDIEVLPARELAYTANLASRSGVVNEAFWGRIKAAFVQDESMKPKFVAQIFLSLIKVEKGDPQLVNLCLKRMVRNIQQFTITDITLVLHGASKMINFPDSLDSIGRHLTTTLSASALSPQLLAVLISAASKLGMLNSNPDLVQKLFSLALANKQDFDEFELAAIIRSFANFGKGHEFIAHGANHISDSHCFSILLRSCRKLGKSVPGLFEQIPMHVSNPDLRPYIFFDAVELAQSQKELQVCIEIARNLLRNWKQVKAVSMPVVFEGLQSLKKKLPENSDVAVLFEEGSALAESVVDRFLLMSSRDEKNSLLASKQARVYSPIWFRCKVQESLNKEEEVTEKGSALLDAEILLRKLWTSEGDQELAHQVVNQYRVEPVLKDSFFSLLFRLVIRQPRLGPIFQEIFKQVDPSVCTFRTLCRFLQVGNSFSKVVSICIERIEEVRPEDIVGFLEILRRQNFSFTNELNASTVEAVLVRKLGLIKSAATQERIQRLGKSVGLDLSETVDLIEAQMFS